jgi:hypothetical protein
MKISPPIAGVLNINLIQPFESKNIRTKLQTLIEQLLQMVRSLILLGEILKIHIYKLEITLF